jgi:hypothetical protein
VLLTTPRVTPLSSFILINSDRMRAVCSTEQQIHFCTTKDGRASLNAKVGQGPPLVKAANWLSYLEFDWRSPF